MDTTHAAQWRRDLDELKDVFTAASAERDARPDYDEHARTFQWVLFERRAMHDAVNRLRARTGQPPVTAGQVELVEISACGHSDYASKYALGCADLVHDMR